ncbi:MAG: site-specific integrase [Stygiobacter sp.]|nr:MAG: site-specific integrase [Stygiobacter sp.]
MDELLNRLSVEDIEKLKWLFSMSNNQQPKEIISLRVFREEYLNLLKSNRSISYYNSVRLSLDYLVDYFGIHCSIASIQQKEIEIFFIKLQEKVKTVSHSANQRGNGYEVYYRNIKAAFNKAKEWNYIHENYFTKVKLPKRQKLSPVFINCDQLSAICEQIKNETVKDVVVFAFYTGMRLDEIVNLKWKNVDNENNTITVGDETFVTKGRKQRFIPICEPLFPILNPKGKHIFIINKNRFVFCKENGEKYSGNYFSRRFKIACKAAGLDKSIHFHSLRHSFASNLAQRGVSIYTIKELLGHSSITTTQIYSHLNMESLREAVNKLDTGCKLLDAGNQPHPNPLPELNSGQALSKEREKSTVKIYRINSGEKR